MQESRESRGSGSLFFSLIPAALAGAGEEGMMGEWLEKKYAQFVAFLARRSRRGCVHGEDVVICVTGPYAMCPLCLEKVFLEQAEEQLGYAVAVLKRVSAERRG